MARKIVLLFLIVLLLFTFTASVFADSIGYGSIADYYTSLTVFQGNSSIDQSVSLPTSGTGNYTINYARSLIGVANTGGAVLFACTDFSENYTGYFSYTDSGKPSVTNYTNVSYELFYRDRNNWVHFKNLIPNETMNYSEPSWYNLDTPFPFVGSEVLVRYNNQGSYVFGNYQSTTLRITSSDSDIENAGIDYPVIFDNAQINIGLNNLKAYVAVSFQSANDTSNWTDMSYVILTNNTELYNESTHSFYITLQNLIDRDLVIGDKIKIEYGWSTIDRFSNPHSYSFYNIYTRSTAYVDGSAYEPPPEPGQGSGGSSGNEDITNSLAEQTQAINDQTNAINQQTDSINNQTNVISGMNDQLFSNSVQEPSSLGVEDTTQNNTPDLSGLYNSFSGAWHSSGDTKVFDLELPNHTHWSIALPSAQIHNFFNNHSSLKVLWDALWWTMLGGYVVFDFKKMYNKFKTGELTTVMTNNSPIDNVVKEILR